MKHKKSIYVLIVLIIINILSTLPFLFIIITGELNGYGWLYKHTLSLRNYIYTNNFLDLVNDLRNYILLIPQIYDLLIFEISLIFGIKSLIARKKQNLNIKIEKILICLVGVNIAISIFEMFFSIPLVN
jgi:hypothetical protein